MGTIRSRLFVSFMLLVLLPAIAFGAVWVSVGFSSARQQVINQLESVATLKEAELNTYVYDLQADLAAVLIGDDTARYMRVILSPEPGPDDYLLAYNQLHDRLGQWTARTGQFDELFIMDRQGRVVLSTDAWREGRFGAPGSQYYLQAGLQGGHLQPPSYNMSVGGMAIVAVHPIAGEAEQVLGVLAGRAGTTRLSEIMLERTGLGGTGETYLVTPSHAMLTAPRFPKEQWLDITYVFSEGAANALDGRESGSGFYDNYRGQSVIGVYRWLPELNVALLAERSESEALQSIHRSVGVNAALAGAIVLIAAVSAILLARSIVVPLAALVDTAGQITAGDLNQIATVGRADEIGALARAFNAMTARLRDLVSSLEQRVEERTRAVQRRALQLETSAQVSRELTSILDLEVLLTRVVELIREAFGYYHVAIFVAEPGKNRLVFGAATPVPPAHDPTAAWPSQPSYDCLPLGPGSLNGEAAHTRQPLLVNDVSKDPRYLADERLPETRAELVVPLQVGARVVGTLDVQSRRADAFGPEDVRMLQSLGDQVAIAMDNARLYDRSRALAILEERNRLARDLHDSVTQSLYSLVLFAGAGQEAFHTGEHGPVASHLNRIEQVAQQALREMRLLIHELRPPTLHQEGLAGALQGRLDAVERRVGIEAYLLVDTELDLPPDVEEQVYRIAQEALNNSLKHAGATSVSIRLRAVGSKIELEVVDDGAGFELEAADGGGRLGLITMRERAERLGAALSIASAPGAGTRVALRFDAGKHPKAA